MTVIIYNACNMPEINFRDSLSLVINENVFNVSADLIEMVFPLLSFEENVEITGQARGNTITTMLVHP